MKKLVGSIIETGLERRLRMQVAACRSRHADFDLIVGEIVLTNQLELELLRTADPMEALYIYARHYSVFG